MFYSPILFSHMADLNLTQYHDCHINIDHLNTKDHITIYCLHSMGYLNRLRPYMEQLQKPFVLISAMEDTQFPLEIEPEFLQQITTHRFFIHWFTINKTIPNDEKFTSIPYGLNFWTLSTSPFFGEGVSDYNHQNAVIETISNESQHFSKRIPKIYGNFHFNFSDDRHGGSRRMLLNKMPKDIMHYEDAPLRRSESYKQMSKFSFVLSPFGHGFDCIRTFEALCLGCIVIMKTSVLDIIYTDLPVCIVKDWGEIDEKFLADTLTEYSNRKFDYDKLTMDYWMRLVNSRFI